MSRLLPWLVGAHALGILLADRLGPPPLALAGVGIAALGLAGLSSGRPRCRVALALSAALAVGGTAAAARRAKPVVLPERAIAIEGRIAERRRGPGGFSARLVGVTAVETGVTPPRRVLLRGIPTPAGLPAFEEHAVGERVRLQARLRAPHAARNPGGGDERTRLARRGVAALARLAHPSLHVGLEPTGGPGPRLRVARARARASRRLAAAGEGGALFAALALGERDGLSRETREALARLGLSHLLAVSGLHLGLVAGGAFWLGRRGLVGAARLAPGRDPRRGALVLALGAASLYAVLAGGGVPVRRALACLVALATGFLARRPLPPLQPLALAALVVLAVDPASLFEAGPQMSFAASAALLRARALCGPRGPVRELLGGSAAAIAATSPLAAVHFGSAPAAGLLANLLAVPWSGVVLLPGALAAAATALLSPDTPGLAAVLALVAQPAEWSLAAARLAAAGLGEPGPPVTPSGLALALAVALALGTLATGRLALRVALVVIASFALGRLPPPVVAPAPPRVVFLDVGQGDAVLVQGLRGALLVDAGTQLPGGVDLGRAVVVPALAALGVDRLDLLVASHADLDHRGGLLAVLDALPVGEIWLPFGAAAEPGFAALLARAAALGVLVRETGAGTATQSLGDLVVRPLWPPRRVGGSDNDRSLVLAVDVAGQRALLPGDLEAAGEAALLASGVALRADVLKLPHHGSRTSSTQAFLAAVMPRWAIASAPLAGRFGMPHPEVCRRVRDAGAALAWTGRDGAVLVGLAAGRARLRGWSRGDLERRGEAEDSLPDSPGGPCFE